MPSPAKVTTATVGSSLRCHHAPATIEWSCAAFGFGKHAMYADCAGRT